MDPLDEKACVVLHTWIKMELKWLFSSFLSVLQNTWRLQNICQVQPCLLWTDGHFKVNSLLWLKGEMTGVSVSVVHQSPESPQLSLMLSLWCGLHHPLKFSYMFLKPYLCSYGSCCGRTEVCLYNKGKGNKCRDEGRVWPKDVGLIWSVPPSTSLFNKAFYHRGVPWFSPFFLFRQSMVKVSKKLTVGELPKTFSHFL